MRVLTFNSHQPYLHLLSTSLDWQFGVIVPVTPGGQAKAWNPAIRPQPANVAVHGSVRDALSSGDWDWVLAHNVHDLLDVRDVALPKVFLVHGTLAGRMLQDCAGIDRKRYLDNLGRILSFHGCRIVYISRLKQADHGLPGVVIPQAVDCRDYGGFSGHQRCILRVCNQLVERGAILGYEAHRAACDGLPSLVLGENPCLPEARKARDWEDLKRSYRSCRVYLHTAVHPLEDGYNLAVLEAMATGMPVATLEHPTSPIEDGADGVVGRTPAELREKVARLLDDPAEATRMGQAAREKVMTRFPLDAFRNGWLRMAHDLP
ncbi:MAG: glycosyltransferase family 4 protein [Acidobacteria bacterium]|nr:glycosyltransferase family 4 protein [Acidobacteriota bacterium]